MPEGRDTMRGIGEQFDAWASVLESLSLLEKDVSVNFAVREYDEVIFTGAGSSYHLAAAAAASFSRMTGEQASSYAASELIFFHQYHLKRERKYLCVFFSRSGETTETLMALDVMKNIYRTTSIGITCDPFSKLTTAVNVAFPVPNCVEESFIMTKSFTSMLVVSLMFSACYGGKFTYMTYLEHLPEEGRASFELQRRVIDSMLKEYLPERVTFLGGGPFLGLAREAALKLDEMSLTRSQAFTPLEIRHGPKAGLKQGDLIVMLMSNSARMAEMQLLHELRAQGVHTLILSDHRDKEFEELADNLILAGRGLSEDIRGVLYMPFLQYLGCRAGQLRGLDPDRPSHLTRVVQF